MLSLLKDLTSLPGVSGDEWMAHGYLKERLASLGRIETTPIGSLLCYLPCEEENVPTVMLEAHIDRIGFIVKEIRDDGYLTVCRCGGIDIRGTLGAEVVLKNSKGTFHGIICSLNADTGKSLPVEVSDLFIDMRMPKEELVKNISIGDRLYIPGYFHELLNDNISVGSIDDRSGCAAIIRAGELLKDCKTAKVVLCFSSQEEVSAYGAGTAASIINPDYAFAVDVSFACTPLEEPEEAGPLGSGVYVDYGPTISRYLGDLLVETAKENNIPYREETMGGMSGTDADTILSSSNGCAATLVSIGERYMHTPTELINVKDVENTGLLISKAVKKLR